MSTDKIGVLVMSYGTPEAMDQVEAYYTHIRRGRPPTEEALQDLLDRYAAIGGVFPLREHTRAQTEALQAELDRVQPGTYTCYQGMKHAAPFIEDGVAAMARDGIRTAIGIVLAPHYSVMSVGDYINRAREAAGEAGITMSFVESYHLHPLFIEAQSERLEAALGRFPAEDREKVHVLFSAHSLPARIVEMNDPYPEQLLETSRAICAETGTKNWNFAWQSAGRTNEPWLGPDILEELERLDGEGVKQVIISPIGFVSDHLEVLYDIDIEARQLAREKGMQLERTDSLNSDPLYIRTLAEAVLAREQHRP